MKFSINQRELDNIMNTVSKAVAVNTTFQSLAGVCIEAVENEIIVQTTNLELSIQVSAPALIEEEGKALLPAKLLSSIVKTLPNEAVSIETDASQAEIVCGKSNFKIRTMNTMDFPDFPQVETIQSVELPYKDFSDMAKKASKMVSKDESKAIITGVLLTVKDGKMNMVAIDGYRVLIAKSEVQVNSTEDFEAVIPGSFLTDVANAFKDVENVKIALSTNQIVVSCNETVFINRRIEGTFPGYEQFFDNDYAIKIKINRQQLDSAARRIAALSQTDPLVKLTFEPSSGVLVLSGAAQDVGSGTESVECEYSQDSSADPVEISFNCNYVMEGLSCIDTKSLFLEVKEPIMPGIFRDETEENLTYMLLAVKTM